MGIIDRGRLIARGTLRELRAAVGGRDTLRLSGVFPVEAVRRALKGEKDVEAL